jgi:zinc transporter ZupT
MRTKQEILAELQAGLIAGVVTEADLKPFISAQPVAVVAEGAVVESKPDKLSAVDVMFYIAGIVLFSTIMSSIAQSWSDGNAFVHIFLSAGIGFILWAIALYTYPKLGAERNS